MGIQSFFKQRRPRQFEHKLIYWDPRKEELEKRVERIRQEMIASGELTAEEADRAVEEMHQQASTPTEMGDYDSSAHLRGTFIRSTEHLQRQHRRGITSSDRDRKTIRLMLALLVLGFAFWYFFIR